ATLFGGNGSGRMRRNMNCSQKWTNSRVHHPHRIHRDVPKSIDGALFDRQHCLAEMAVAECGGTCSAVRNGQMLERAIRPEYIEMCQRALMARYLTGSTVWRK